MLLSNPRRHRNGPLEDEIRWAPHFRLHPGIGPSAHIVDEDDLEIGRARLHVGDQLLECLPPVDAQSALALVGVGAGDLDVAPGGVLADLVAL